MQRLLLPVLALLALSGGCRRDGPTDLAAGASVRVTSDRAQYSVAANDVARVTITNESDRAVYLPMAQYVLHEHLVDGAWRDESSWFTVDGIGMSIEVPPGATLTDGLSVARYLVKGPGTYRFRYLVFADAQWRSPLPVDQRVSAPFLVTP